MFSDLGQQGNFPENLYPIGNFDFLMPLFVHLNMLTVSISKRDSKLSTYIPRILPESFTQGYEIIKIFSIWIYTALSKNAPLFNAAS